MKKVVVISIIFAAVLGIAVWEICYTSAIYTDLENGLSAVHQSILIHGPDTDNPYTLEEMDKVMERWNNGKDVLFCLGNHSVLRTVDEKLVSLNAMINTNYKDDAMIMIDVAKSLVRALQNDAAPVITNFF